MAHLRYRSRRAHVVFLVLLGSVSACALVDPTSDQDAEEGYLSMGFEVSAFLPCSVAESWWLDGEKVLLERIQSSYGELAAHEYEWVYARLAGTRSAQGTFGHMGAYDRLFTVGEVVEIRPVRKGDCVWPGRAPEITRLRQ